MMVLADPGMGKTTLLKREAYLIAQEQRQSLEDNNIKLENVVIPIFIRLSEIAELTKEVTAKVIDAILKLLEVKYEKYFPEIKTFLEEKLKAGKCLLLLDALDEVPKENRKRLSDRLNDFYRNYSCSIICTSRIVGYDGAFLTGVKDVEIVPFTQKQIKQYIEIWFENAAENLNNDSVSASSLIRELQNKPQIRGLVQNPLLLSLICSLYQEKGLALPARRCEVYKQALHCMLGRWSQNRQPQSEGRIKAKIRFLEHLAYNFTCAGKEIFSSDQLYDQVEDYLQSTKVATVFRDADTDKLIRELSEQDGILQKLHENGDQYLFLHRTFQEYLTACYLQRYPNCVELAKAHFWDYEWHEILSLLAGLMENPVSLLEEIMGEKDDIFSTLLLLGGLCLAECQGIYHQLVGEIIDNIYDFLSRYPNNTDFIESVLVTLGKTHSQMFDKLQTTLNNDNKKSLKPRAISALGKIGSPKIIPCLIKIITSDEDFFVRLMAAGALGDIGHPEAIPTLIRVSNDDSCYFVRQSAKYSLKQLDFPLTSINSTTKNEENTTEVSDDITNIKLSDVLNIIRLFVCSKDKKIRWSVAHHLGRIGNPIAVSALISGLEDEDEKVIKAVVSALGKIGNREALNALIQSLNHPNSEVRKNVVCALGTIGTVEAVNALIQALKHLDSNVRQAAAFILGYINSHESVDELIKVLSNINEDSSVREYSARALGEIGDCKAIPVLVTAITEKNLSVRRNAAEALVRVGTSDTLAKLIQNPNIDIYDLDIFLLARKLAVKFSKEQVPFIPVYPELLGKSLES
ncbi:HEAT repeat domain-containing protein [Cylindrospermum stagnale]|uniref:HEAT repeat domain-containing protein n=1 Tax=Cylindrospermum stagnale TaxID=142864 RepID=UPI0006863BE2|nr:HEAT repeat domain-containing protein [Cylindrospermum stagnale]